MKKLSFILLLITSSCLTAFSAPSRIITLSSTLTETVYELGFGNLIVATDVTSESPKAAAKLPRMSQNRAVSAEGLMAFRPDLVLAIEGDVSRSVIQHLQSSGVRFVAIRQQYSAKGALEFIKNVAAALDESQQGTLLAEATATTLEVILSEINKSNNDKPSILFIYARGTGTLSVAGKGSQIDAIISLAGARNAVQEFSDFKPYTTEALVKANPDIILMFDFGLNSLGGKEAVLKMPGVRITQAGKNKRIIEMEASLLVNFSSRLPEAIRTLHEEIQQAMTL